MSHFFDKYLKKAPFPHKGLHYSKRLSHGGHMLRSLLLVEVFIYFFIFDTRSHYVAQELVI